MASVDVTRIASNIGALNALNSLTLINKKLALHQTALSTGKRINSAADDPAGLTIATKMLARSEGLKASQSNISDAKNMLSVAEGGLSTMTDIMIQMRTKAEQAASDTLGSSERSAIATQLSAFSQQIQDLVDQTKWNGVKLLDNTTGSKTFQTGVDEGETTSWTLPGGIDPNTMGLSTQVVSDTATADALATSFQNDGTTPVASLANYTTLTKLTTGDYNFTVLDKALTSNAEGKFNLDTTSSLISGMSGVTETTATATGDNIMTSGNYTLKITGTTSETQTSYTLQKIGDTSFNSGGSMVISDVNLTSNVQAATVAVNAQITGASSVTTTLGAGTAGALGELAGGNYTVRMTSSKAGVEAWGNGANTIKIELLDSTGAAVQISDAAGGGGNAAAFGTVLTGDAALGTWDTGRGLIINYSKTAGTSGTAVTAAATYTRKGSAGELLDAAGYAAGVQTGAKLGLKIGSGAFASLAIGQTMSFEYIKAGDVKLALQDGTGQAQTIARNTAGTITGTSAYQAYNTEYNSGRGVAVKLHGTWDSITPYSTSSTTAGVQNFTYERANNYSVNVSTASRAGAYMTTVSTALDKVTGALSDLGSLMARLTYKEDQTATDQVNVEGAYSRIMNANMAEEQLNASKYTILQQTATAMLAQANAAPQSLLTLFR